ncbi:arabinan endo-1,5-alpha-L-arabinosidase C [Sclerotinia borealis F-4128]|uniref:Arabinan endo-1,5-alpha-L-arabinosidase n=1 Tax=Sclerotinia borealis (strain F-4128) TaxID=1432307 RepID=W9C9Q1_SCLBF|nr:arabinan endo-1,5-alpha-L-arabinosidase C [Sclerotinia borealis F-4128]
MFSRLLLPLLGLLSLVAAYSNPGSCSGNCYAHDPSLIQRSSDGTWFQFNTGNGIGIWKATALAGPWTYVGDALSGGSKIDLTGNTDLWAPDVHLVGSTYYMYYAVSAFGSQNSAIGVATSTTMEVGSWTDRGATGVASSSGKLYNAIDPNLILVGSTYYLNFGSFWDDIYQVAMSSTPTKASGSASYNLAYNSTGTHAEEGSYMFYYSGYYYLLISSGICCGYDTSKPASGAEYKIVMCRSTSATGNFVDQSGKACAAGGGTTLLASHGNVYGPGGQGVYLSSSGPILYYHYANPTIGLGDANYRFGYNYLTFSNGWPVV